MYKVTRYYKKIKLVYITSALFICFVMIFAFPWMKSSANEGSGYYVAVLNGQKLGAVSSSSIIREAYNEARLKLDKEAGSLVYVEPDLVIYEQDRLIGEREQEQTLADKMYEVLKTSVVSVKQKAYTVNIDGFTVTLNSKDDVLQLLNTAKSKYDTDNQFSIDLIDSDEEHFSAFTTSMVKADTEPKEDSIVMSSENGNVETAAVETAAPVYQDGIVEIAFGEDVEVVESYVNTDQITDVNTAIDLVTKDKEENKLYEVESGDCLTTIADKFNLSLAKLLEMNSYLTADSTIDIGDEIVVTVPEPELSVIVKEERTYEEDYNAPIQYIDDDSMYQGEEVVQQEGTTGHRQVVAIISYRNGDETGREIIHETIMNESVPQVVIRGTLVPPTYIKPLSGGTLSSGFEKRWGTFHYGIDWACPIGTAIKASCGGTVISAGWASGYGYCVTLQHPDGKQTRYGHLSKILVSVGQKVAQGEKIALSGNTGDSTGPHVHFEIIVNGTRVNPMNYLN